MVTKLTRYEKKLYSLERMRRDIEKKLDRSYLQNNISELLALEAKYENIVQQISRLKDLVVNSSRISIII